MKKFVVDASISLKWLPLKNEERFLTKARNVLEALTYQKIEILAPTFLLFEISNVLLMKKKVSLQMVKKIINTLCDSDIVFENFQKEDTKPIAKIMAKYGIAAYDAQYLYLAIKNKCKLITLDKKLLEIKNWTISLNDF